MALDFGELVPGFHVVGPAPQDGAIEVDGSGAISEAPCPHRLDQESVPRREPVGQLHSSTGSLFDTGAVAPLPGDAFAIVRQGERGVDVRCFREGGHCVGELSRSKLLLASQVRLERREGVGRHRRHLVEAPAGCAVEARGQGDGQLVHHPEKLVFGPFHGGVGDGLLVVESEDLTGNRDARPGREHVSHEETAGAQVTCDLPCLGGGEGVRAETVHQPQHGPGGDRAHASRAVESGREEVRQTRAQIVEGSLSDDLERQDDDRVRIVIAHPDRRLQAAKPDGRRDEEDNGSGQNGEGTAPPPGGAGDCPGLPSGGAALHLHVAVPGGLNVRVRAQLVVPGEE